MNLTFYKPTEPTGKIKCTIHKNGKLGFSSSAIKELTLTKGKFLKFGTNKEDDFDKDLYMLVSDNDDGECFILNKAGNYYYVNTTGLFNEIELDYKNQKIIYDINKIMGEDNLFKLSKRVKKRKK